MKRNELVAFLNQKGIEVKVHYPIPIHLQKATRTIRLIPEGQEGD